MRKPFKIGSKFDDNGELCTVITKADFVHERPECRLLDPDEHTFIRARNFVCYCVDKDSYTLDVAEIIACPRHAEMLTDDNWKKLLNWKRR